MNVADRLTALDAAAAALQRLLGSLDHQKQDERLKSDTLAAYKLFLDDISQEMRDLQLAVSLQDGEITGLAAKSISKSTRSTVGVNSFCHPTGSSHRVAKLGELKWAAPMNSARCTICLDSEPVLVLYCGCRYCEGCLIRALEISLQGDNPCPPLCCQKPIPITTAPLNISEELFQKISRRILEHKTPTRERRYCRNCGQFVYSVNSKGWLECPDCKSETCKTCKEFAHTDTCSPQDDDGRVLELAKVKGWSRCPKCQQVVEKIAGCNYIVCRCQTGFCYLCRKLASHYDNGCPEHRRMEGLLRN